MEGIPVKISEKYKPPRKITLPLSVQNKLNVELKLEKYDFQLERLVVDQMAKLKEHHKQISEAKNTEDTSFSMKLEETKGNSDILTPMPLKPVQTSAVTHQVIGGFNISDFENDTSSPFDSVELKTLNDMEELAHVLGGSSLSTTKKWHTPENGSNTQHWTWGAGYPQQPTPYPLHVPPVSSESGIVSKPVKNQDNQTTKILQTLRKHIEERQLADAMSRKSSGLSIAAGISNQEMFSDKKRELLPNPLSSLNSQSQAVARAIAEMGFPISRAARATDMFGPIDGKVIEFMLEVQSLEEAGYPGERAERALVICKYSRDDAIKFLDSMEQIMRLGFAEDDVIAALIKMGFDRDKALDSLIS